jgi:hypothetical protein
MTADLMTQVKMTDAQRVVPAVLRPLVTLDS